MNIVIYARFSSHSQTEQSIEGQLAVCQRYAQQNNMQVIGTYIDRAISGTTDSRPDFQRMIADSGKHQFQAVLVYQLDRFSRDRYDSAIYKNKLKKNGARVISAMEPISDDASGVLMESVLEGMAEYYSAELRQKVKRGLAISLENGTVLGGTTPLGFKIENKRYVINEETAPVVRKIFEMYLAHNTMAEIVQYLNAQGMKTSRGNPYNKNSIRTILTNKRYLGIYVHHGKECPNKMPAIVEKDIFEQAQIMMEKNKKAPARAKAKEEQYILTTKLYCGHCKAPMTGVSGTSKTGAIHQYYSCVDARKHRSSCHKANVRKAEIENRVIQLVRTIMSDENIDMIADELISLNAKEIASSNIPRLKKALAENKKAQQNLLHAIEQGQALEVLSAQLEMRHTEQCQIESQIAAETLRQESQQLKKTDIVTYLRSIRNGSADSIVYRQSMIDVFVDSIYLYDTDDGKNKKITVLLNTQDGKVKKEIPINDTESSFMGTMVEN